MPPVERGHAAAGEDPELGTTVADALAEAPAEALGRTDEVAEAEGPADGETEREADGRGVGDACVSGWGPHALTTTMPMARARAPYRIKRPNIWPKPA